MRWPKWFRRCRREPPEYVLRAELEVERADEEVARAEVTLKKVKEEREKSRENVEWALEANTANRFDARLQAAIRRSARGGA